MARTIRLNHTVEHRFVFAAGEEPKPAEGHENFAFAVTDPVDVPDTDLKAQVWRLQRGAELSVHDREADRLTKLQDADGIAYATEGDLAELPVVQAPDPTDPVDRTPREEAERAASEAGHTVEGELRDHDAHREFARRTGIEPGGPAAPTAAPRPAAATIPPAPRRAAADTPSATAPAPNEGAGGAAQPTPQPAGGPNAQLAGIQPASPGGSTVPSPGPADAGSLGRAALSQRPAQGTQGVPAAPNPQR
jgi:hypothetical protein